MFVQKNGNRKEAEPIAEEWVLYRLEEGSSDPIKTVIDASSNDPYSKFIVKHFLGIGNQIDNLRTNSELTDQTKARLERLQEARAVLTGESDYLIKFHTVIKGKKLKVLGFSLVSRDVS